MSPAPEPSYYAPAEEGISIASHGLGLLLGGGSACRFVAVYRYVLHPV